MSRFQIGAIVVGVCLLGVALLNGRAQSPKLDSPATGAAVTTGVAASPQAIVPRLIKFSGVLQDAAGKAISGPVDVTFTLYSAEAGGEPLWFETQTVQADEQGRYTILLGAMHADGLPTDLFTSGQAHWLGVQVGLEAERPRVLLVSVPYALKAGDADTLGGKPASAYMLSEAQTTSASGATSTAPSSQSGNVQTGKSTKSTSPSAPTSTVVTPGGTANNLAKFFDATTIVNSALFESGGNVGIGTSSPFYSLDVHAATNANLGIYAVGGSVYASAHNDMNTLQVPWAIYTSQLGLMGGKVGIGTTSPQGPVQVKTGQSASTQSLMIGGPNLMPAGVTFNSINDGNTANEPMELRASAFGFTQGNVGIGTATPQGPLQVKAGQSASTQSFMIGGPILMPAGVTLNSINDLNAANEPMELRASVFGLTQGNVGIGTPTPGATLDVNGTANFAGLVSFAAGQTVTGNVTSSGQLVSSVATGTAPLQVASTTQVPNLDASLLGGLPASAFQPMGSYAVTTGPNSFAGTQTVNSGDVSISSGNLDLPYTNGTGTAGVIMLGGNSFIHACCSTAQQNTSVGVGAGNFTSPGKWNTASGYQALHSITMGGDNTANGFQALLSNTTGSDNTATGLVALQQNTTGNENTAVGADALTNNTNGNFNTAVGVEAFLINGTGNNNTALGFSAGFDQHWGLGNITGSNNTFIGYSSGSGTLDGLNNSTAIGANAVVSASNALVLGGTGGNAVSVGIGTATPQYTLDVHGTGNFTGLVTFAGGQTFPGTGTVTSVASGAGLTGGPITTSGTLSIATGGVTNTMLANPSLTVTAGTGLTGGGSVSLGGSTTLSLASASCAAGSAAVALPLSCSPFAMLGANTFVGTQTITSGDLALPDTASSSVGVVTLGGVPFVHDCCGGSSNGDTFVGAGAGNFTTTGIYNTASGYQALSANTTGGDNTAIGLQALFANTTGSDNTASGWEVLHSNTTGSSNTASGFQALNLNTNAGDNTATGYQALYANSTGSNNTAVGFQAGVNSGDTFPTNGSNSTYVGANATASADNLTNATAIGFNAAVGESNALVLGGTGGNAVKVGIGTPTPAYTLDVQGTGRFTGLVTFAGGQTFPGTGTITGVTAGTGLSGGGVSGSVTLNNSGILAVGVGTGVTTTGGQTPTLAINTTVVPQLATPNTFAADQTLNAALNLPQTSGTDVGVINLAGTSFIHACCPKSLLNTFVGIGAGNFAADATGSFSGYGHNTAIGRIAMRSLTSGYLNVASGDGALAGNTAGFENTALGFNALATNATGNQNTAVGNDAGINLGSSNSQGGSSNIMVGIAAGINFNANESNNIDIGNQGVAGESGVIRIGTGGLQTSGYIAGIRGVTTGNNDAVAVLIDSNGQLGTVSSSRRYKEDIHDMGAASDGLLRLRPVTFRYKKPYDDGSKPIQYGLIAEEVANVYPDLVVRNKDGQVETVQYYKLDAMLLSEVQKLAQAHAADQAEIEKLKSQIARQQEQIAARNQDRDAERSELAQLRAQVERLAAVFATNKDAEGSATAPGGMDSTTAPAASAKVGW